MMITDILPIINAIAETASRNEKEAILMAQQDNYVVRQFFEASTNPFRVYNTKTIPEYACASKYLGMPLTLAINQLPMFENREVSGRQAQDKLSSILSSLSEENAELFCRIIMKDSKCGLGATTLNKIWPDLIPVDTYMGATAMSDAALNRLNYESGVYSQNKEDGLFQKMIFNKAGVPTSFGRSGLPYDFKGGFDYLGETFKNCRVEGEIRVFNPEFTKFLHRKQSNGIVNRYQEGKPAYSTIGTDRMCFIVWDIVPLADSLKGRCNIPYSNRLNVLYNAVKVAREQNYDPMTQIHSIPEIRLVETKIIYSLDEAKAMFKTNKARGEEGLILKEKDAPWQDGKPWWQVKLKNETEADFKIIGHNEHSKKKGTLGSFLVASADGKIVTSCGSGLTDELALEYWESRAQDIESIISLKFESIIWKEGSEVLSLNLPIFLEKRVDQTKAHTLAECIALWEGTTGCVVETEISSKINN